MFIRYTIEKELRRYDDPEQYTDHIEGELIVDPEVDEAAVGLIKARLIHVTLAFNEGESLFEVFDSVDADQRAVGDSCFEWDPEGKRNHGINEALVDCNRYGDVLFVSSMELLPNFRKKGLGYLLMRSVIETFGAGCSIVVIEPGPILYEGTPNAWLTSMQIDQFTTDNESGRRALRRHWSKLGFKPVPNTKNRFWYFPMESRLPPIPKREIERFERLQETLHPED